MKKPVKFMVELVSADLRHLQETNVDMLVINGTLDFSTPPNALKEYEGYYHNVQTVLLPEYSHVSDLITLQPEATRLLITSYYDTGIGDTSLFTYQAVNFKPKMSTTLMAKLAIGVIVLLPPLLIWLLVRIIRRKSTNSKNNKQNHLKVVS